MKSLGGLPLNCACLQLHTVNFSSSLSYAINNVHHPSFPVSLRTVHFVHFEIVRDFLTKAIQGTCCRTMGMFFHKWLSLFTRLSKDSGRVVRPPNRVPYTAPPWLGALHRFVGRCRPVRLPRGLPDKPLVTLTISLE